MRFKYKDSSKLYDLTIQQLGKKLHQYIQHLNVVVSKKSYDDDESSINLPADTDMLQEVKALADNKRTAGLKYVIIIGIGGSNLGTKAFYDALYGFYDVFQPERFPKMIFLDTQDEEVLDKTKHLIDSLDSKDELLINAISKSGGTTETMANLEVVYDAMRVRFGEDIHDRFVFTTDKDSMLHKTGRTHGIDVLNLPAKVGGRYSVLSAVGMFPLAVMNFGVEEIQEGASEMRNLCLQDDIEHNPAALSAIVLYQHYQEGKVINDNFIFLPQLESLGKWYRQLMGESIGKDGKGITPTVSIGSTDLHSVGQLYLGGPNDKITTFIYSEGIKVEAHVPPDPQFNLIPSIAGKPVEDIMRAILEGTKAAYLKQDIPFTEIVFDIVTERSIAEFMQFKMIEMMYLGKLLEVNTFDQPHVELYKVETKKILGK